jgi:hypothetical protein
MTYPSVIRTVVRFFPLQNVSDCPGVLNAHRSLQGFGDTFTNKVGVCR